MRKLLSLAVALLMGAVGIAGAYANNMPNPVGTQGLGVNIHFTGAPAKDLDMIRDAGFKFIRTDFKWDFIERSKGQYDFSQYDQLVNGLKSRGMRALFILDYNNPVYGVSWNSGVTSSANITAFANFAKAATAHYKGQGVVWELWNEPNGNGFWSPSPNTSEYVNFAKGVIPAMRAGDPDAAILAPAVSMVDLAYLEGCFQKGLLPLVDAVTIHPYRYESPESIAAEIQKVKALIAKYNPSNPNIPVLTSEWGYHAVTLWGGMSETVQGKFLPRMFLHNMMLGNALSIWYDWRNDGTDPNNAEHNYGVVRNDYSIKPAYQAMQKLNQAIGGMRFEKRLSSASSDYLLQFTNGTKTTVAAWTTGSAHSVTINGQSVNINDTPVYVTVSTTTPPPPTDTAPAAPSNLTVTSVVKGATSGNYFVNLQWKDNSTNESNFKIYQSINSTSNFQHIKSPSANTTTYGVNIGSSPTPGTYYYKIIAINGSGESAPSNIASGNVLTSTVNVPAAPTGLSATTGKDISGRNVVYLNWQDNSGNEEGFNVYLQNSPTAALTKLGQLLSNQTLVFHIPDATVHGVQYLYQLKAFNQTGESASSNTVTVNLP